MFAAALWPTHKVLTYTLTALLSSTSGVLIIHVRHHILELVVSFNAF